MKTHTWLSVVVWWGVSNSITMLACGASVNYIFISIFQTKQNKLLFKKKKKNKTKTKTLKKKKKKKKKKKQNQKH
jgi:phosphate/sulfate permease